MKVWAVMVQDGLGHRWIDSLWVTQYAARGADNRMSDLTRMFKNMNISFAVWITEMTVEDAEIAPKPNGTTGQKGTKKGTEDANA